MKMNHLFDYDDSLLCGLVGDDVEYVMATNDTVLHLSVTPDIWIISLDTADVASDVCRLHSSHAKGIYTGQ